ncbi:Fe-S protein [uncultured Microbacterium sp.]|uniref:Fe-S protein n=1 Tax=uncultured Microbacterium sp. TaxID=191216 RepID=UPI0025E75E14|nr:Fe-S protein [uncultured Microbacterium sp.]
MEILRHVVLLVHLIGFATLFGAWLTALVQKKRVFSRLMTEGMGIAFLAGLVLSAPFGLSYELNYVKIGVKLVVLLVIGAILGIGTARQKRTGSLPAPMFWSVGILTLLNAALAVLWR